MTATTAISHRTQALLFLRHARSGFHSIETVFGTVTAALPADIAARMHVSPAPSQGLRNRWRSVRATARAMRAAPQAMGHVLGDEHFLVFGIPRARCLLTVHDCDFLAGKRGLKRWLLWLLWLYLPVWWARHVTTISERTRADVIALTGCAPDKVSVIENPLEEAFAAPKQTQDQAQSQTRPQIPHIGTKTNKNLPRLIAAMQGLKADLVLVGKPTQAQRSAIETAGISWTNLVDIPQAQLVQAYGDATLVHFTSLTEGFGMPIIEAQAAGTPVLTSDRAPMCDVAGDGALLVDPEDTDAIRAGLIRRLEEPALRADLVARGRANLARFAPAHIAARYGALYRQMAPTQGVAEAPKEGAA